MKITSMDITSKEFKKTIRGYDCDDVDEFLEKIAEDYETLYKENSTLKEKITLLTDQVESYSKMQSTIQNTLVLAQEASEQAKISAQKESELIIKNANDAAQKILDKAHKDVLDVNDEYERIKQEFLKFKSRYKNFMNSQIEFFENLEKEFYKNYSLGKEVEEFKSKEIIEEKDKNSDGDKDVNYKSFKINDVSLELFDDNSKVDEIKNFFAK